MIKQTPRPAHSQVGKLIRPGIVRSGEAPYCALLFFFCFLLGGYLRYSSLMNSGLWRDECQFLAVARLPTISEMFNFLIGHESQPPLFYLVMRFWDALFGRSDAASQCLPIIGGLALIALAYVVGRRFLSAPAGVVACLLVAISNDLIVDAVSLRPYVFLSCLCLLSTYWLWQALEQHRWRWWVLYGLCMLAMLYTHNWCLIVLAADTLIACFLLAIRGPGTRCGGFMRLIATTTAVALCYAPWAPVLASQALHAGHQHLALDTAEFLFRFEKFASCAACLPNPAGACALIGVAAAVAGIGCILARGEEEKRSQLAVLLLLLGMPMLAFIIAAALSPIANLLMSHCYGIVTPCVLVAFAVTWGRLLNRFKLLSLSALTGLLVWMYGSNCFEYQNIRSNARELGAQVGSQVHRDDLVVIVPEFLSSSFNHYFNAEVQQIDFPYFGREEAVPYNDLRDRYLDVAAYENTKAELRKAHIQRRRVWLITTYLFPYKAGARSAYAGFERAMPCGFLSLQRAHQIFLQLCKLYGRPYMLPSDGRKGREILRAYVFG